MRMTFKSVAFGLGCAAALSLVSMPASAHPSFSCSGNLKAAEQVVCDDTGLQRVDRNLAKSYQAVISHSGFFHRFKVRRMERQFIAERNRCGDNETCVRVAYRGQSQYLRGEMKRLGVTVDYD